MAEQAHKTIHIDATPEQSYDLAVDFESYPSWAKDVKQATVLERDDEGRGSKVEFRAASMGRSIRYVLAYDFGEAPKGFSWKLIEGDMVRQLDGSYHFDADGDGTCVIYDVAIDLSVPVPGLIKRRAASLIVGNALGALKKALEKG